MPGLSAGHPRDVEPVEALAGVLEAEAFGDHLLAAQPVQRVAHGPGRQVRPPDDLLLRQQPAGLQHFVDQLGGRRKVLQPDDVALVRYSYRSDAITGKNDPSWYVSPYLHVLNNS